MNTKDRIIKVALKMISERGYEWLSFKKIADEIGIAKSSIYHYFKTKEELGIAVMEVIEEKRCNSIERLLKYKTEKEKLEFFIRKKYLIERTYIEVIAKLFADFEGLPENLQKIVKENFLKDQELLRSIIKKGIENKEFKLKRDLDEVVMAIILIHIGTYFYSRIIDCESCNLEKIITELL